MNRLFLRLKLFMGKMIIKNRRRQDWNPNPLGMEATTSATVPQILCTVYSINVTIYFKSSCAFL